MPTIARNVAEVASKFAVQSHMQEGIARYWQRMQHDGHQWPTYSIAEINLCKVVINPLLKSAAGKARFLSNGYPRVIELHPALLDPQDKAREECVATFLHEVGHLMEFAFRTPGKKYPDHGPLWQIAMRCLCYEPSAQVYMPKGYNLREYNLRQAARRQA